MILLKRYGVAFVLFCIGLYGSVNGRDIVGSATLVLNTPITPQLKEAQRALASDSLANALKERIDELYPGQFDHTNPVSEYFLNRFFIACRAQAQEKSYLDKRDWTMELTVTDSVLSQTIVTHNAKYDSVVNHFTALVNESMQSRRDAVTFIGGIHVLYFAKALIGEFSKSATSGSAASSIQQIRSSVQKIINKIIVEFSSPIIVGKPPHVPDSDIRITVMADSTPLPGVSFSGSLPDKKAIFRYKTDQNGEISLSQLKIPFVMNGTFLHIRPDFSAIVDASFEFSSDDLGLILSEETDQTLIFNIIKPSYTLEYSVNSVNNIEVPESFSNENILKNFFSKSYPLELAKVSDQADLIIKINCQVSSYTNDATEQTHVKVETHAAIKERSSDNSGIERITVLHEKSYDNNHAIPIGLFFWESENALRALFGEMLDSL